ncbi:uncharacterized protein CANTADRAFT_23035 [Suhomyces tanzawaensis NRRL Y-17324]|uniref:Zn(2)-C6 fungal-type domain-containing protein n=1 Tax=Suhomyces tanzawaensis NRRL Y-17324 TaxID=984487 RepID=A0A1E4SEI1_9ASCO|nr:uncharacterized protein CANTADRAFT_23035 [Suhomyces tanzawaensis NRRL Y-17324]ODV77917.1 hypothetical protein CANTADRAFT_23035 [Suhomyces tanzawaensis NRRL Y-17324]
MTDYKSYQQVLSIGVKRAGAKPKKVTKPKSQPANIKRRTKTGCLTCRKRKKKCDEDKVNGKCQGCTRNFLECCWPAEQELAPKAEPSVLATPVVAPMSPVSTPPPAKCTIESMLATPINPYPSPIASPISEPKKEPEDVKFLALPPLAHKKQPPQPEPTAKFIITSFNTHNDLCQVFWDRRFICGYLVLSAGEREGAPAM